ncbi:MAG: heparinase II/III family protein [Alphaproteobacteria bacterium]|nr:heparinase II/III family protein [Alphaproteobacteria bacterium]
MDFSPRSLEEANALLNGKFSFAGESVKADGGSIFDKAPPSNAWAETLHGFGWLASLAEAGGEPARTLACDLIGQWLHRYGRYSEPAWRAGVLARRLLNLFSHGRFVLARSDLMWRSRLLVSLREQTRMLARVCNEAPEGVPRLQAAAALALSGLCIDGGSRRLAAGLSRLESELSMQILPDGGHISRSPLALLCAYQIVVCVTDVLARTEQDIPPGLRNARDRMAPMLRFFRLGDGALAMFNGGRESDAKALASLLARDDVRGQPFAFAPHSAYHRLAAGRTLVVMDCGAPPPGVYANTAHSGCLGFEFSAGHQRVVVNCGTSDDHTRWQNALRATAAHSTIVLGDRSVGYILSGIPSRLLGPRLLGGPTRVETIRHETAGGGIVDAMHDGYVPAYGVIHQRRITLSPAGTMLSGTDRLTPGQERRPQPVSFAARFHVHPDIRVSASQGGGAILKLPSGEGWRFQATGAQLSLEKSIYVANESARRAEQLVLSGTVRNEPVDISWFFERFGNS